MNEVNFGYELNKRRCYKLLIMVVKYAKDIEVEVLPALQLSNIYNSTFIIYNSYKIYHLYKTFASSLSNLTSSSTLPASIIFTLPFAGGSS